jgi:hypothetical protein
LEAFGMLSFIRFGKVDDFVRLESMTDLFHDENLDEILSREADSKALEIAFKDDLFQGQCYDKERVTRKKEKYNIRYHNSFQFWD